jgi:hypothetical protein
VAEAVDAVEAVDVVEVGPCADEEEPRNVPFALKPELQDGVKVPARVSALVQD